MNVTKRPKAVVGRAKFRQTAPVRRLQIIANGPTAYEFSVDGTVERKTGGLFEAETSNDSISEQNGTVQVAGTTGCADQQSGCFEGDTWLIQGDMTSLSVTPESGVTHAVQVDGVEMGSESAVNEIDGSLNGSSGSNGGGGAFSNVDPLVVAAIALIGAAFVVSGG